MLLIGFLLSMCYFMSFQAKKRAAWREARLKSLEQDAMQAELVIKKMSELASTSSNSLSSLRNVSSSHSDDNSNNNDSNIIFCNNNQVSSLYNLVSIVAFLCVCL